jgi:hypothetical protein
MRPSFSFGNSDLLGRSLLEAEINLRPGRGRGDDESAEQRRCKHPAFHFGEPPVSHQPHCAFFAARRGWIQA